MADPILLQLILFALASAPVDELDRAELAAAIKNGDHKAYKTFFEEHHERLFRFLRSKNITTETAEDLIQQAFIYIWENRSSINPEKSLRSYLFRIAYTRMLNHVRDHKKFDKSEPVPAASNNHTPEDAARARDLNQAIEKTLERMPQKRSMVFELCFMEGFTYKEAADALDVSIKTIENHMGLAFKDMRKSLQKFI